MLQYADNPEKGFLARPTQVGKFLKVYGTPSRAGFHLAEPFESQPGTWLDNERAPCVRRQLVNVASGSFFACARFRKQKDRHFALRKLPDNQFKRAHTLAKPFHEGIMGALFRF
jgi:hypothetical protein